MQMLETLAGKSHNKTWEKIGKLSSDGGGGDSLIRVAWLMMASVRRRDVEDEK